MMGSNNNSNTPGGGGSDPRGQQMNQSGYQQQRFENQQGPLANTMAMNYGRGSEADYGNYMDMMNNYRDIASGNAGAGFSGGAGYVGDQSYLTSPGTYNAYKVDYTDPFNSYSGYQNFSNTGGFSAQDMQDLRERGTAPVRAAYANAEQGIARQRALSNGYSPNSVAAMAKMAREQSQGMSDAMQNVNAGIINQRNANQLQGLGGMQGIESQRLGAQIGTGEFNAQQQAQAEQGNIQQQWALEQANSAIQARNLAARQAAANSAASGGQANLQARLQALGGMQQLYGTTPGMSATFGNQALNAVNMGGQFGLGLLNAGNNTQRLPGAYDTTMGRIGDLVNTGANLAYPFLNSGGNNQNQQQPGMAYPMSNPGTAMINPTQGMPNTSFGGWANPYAGLDNTYNDFG